MAVQLGDVVAQPWFDGESVGVVVGAEIAEAGGRVGQQVPDDDEDGAGDRDQGLEFAAAFDDAPVAFAKEGVGFGGGGGGLAERTFQVGVVFAGLAGAGNRLGLDGCVGTAWPMTPDVRGWGTCSCPVRVVEGRATEQRPVGARDDVVGGQKRRLAAKGSQAFPAAIRPPGSTRYQASGRRLLGRDPPM